MVLKVLQLIIFLRSTEFDILNTDCELSDNENRKRKQ